MGFVKRAVAAASTAEVFGEFPFVVQMMIPAVIGSGGQRNVEQSLTTGCP